MDLSRRVTRRDVVRSNRFGHPRTVSKGSIFFSRRLWAWRRETAWRIIKSVMEDAVSSAVLPVHADCVTVSVWERFRPARRSISYSDGLGAHGSARPQSMRTPAVLRGGVWQSGFGGSGKGRAKPLRRLCLSFSAKYAENVMAFAEVNRHNLRRRCGECRNISMS